MTKRFNGSGLVYLSVQALYGFRRDFLYKNWSLFNGLDFFLQDVASLNTDQTELTISLDIWQQLLGLPLDEASTQLLVTTSQNVSIDS